MNVVDDELIELYAQQGRLTLHRFGYLALEPPLGSVSLRKLIQGVTKRLHLGQIFEVELGGPLDIDAGERDVLLSQGIRVVFHEDPREKQDWWALGKDIDPTESDSY
ncbi:hypothetical protein BDN70DRAFT_681649 [Pholiota conissans]|uniref:Uncharacterized protein n=1 Tax=Pholiota conissans TaxID=109636 RepID=A0A9P5ZF02_9AGAR|nr:hypothetical protein BDN70DRAFT_681649 [Pholiota conissans]